MPGYRVLDTAIESRARRDFAIDVLVGLSERPKRLPSRYFYDDEGSRLFARIMELEEYYLSRAEHELLLTHRERICAAAAGAPFDLVDLGAGDGRKTELLLSHLMERGARFRYVPIDVSEAAMRELVERLQATYPGIVVEGIVSEYLAGLDWLSEQAGRRSLVLFLGSNIGNFDPVAARLFLRRLWNALEHDDLALIGFDLKKDVQVLVRAYDDAHGITRAFNLNLLARINRELGGGFDLAAFTHFPTYNVRTGAMESHLLSTRRQTVRIEALQRSFEFEPWEPIHTECSFKYLEEGTDRMAEEAGFVVQERFRDEQRSFMDALWRVEKAPVR